MDFEEALVIIIISSVLCVAGGMGIGGCATYSKIYGQIGTPAHGPY